MELSRSQYFPKSYQICSWKCWNRLEKGRRKSKHICKLPAMVNQRRANVAVTNEPDLKPSLGVLSLEKESVRRVGDGVYDTSICYAC